MRSAAVLFALTLATAAHAQQQPAPRVPSAPPTVPPPITLPMPPLAPQPAGGLLPTFQMPAPTPAPPRDLYRVPGRGFRARPHAPAIGGYFAPYSTPYFPGLESPAPDATAAIPVGTLRLDLSGPSTTQVFVDDYYVGTIDDVEARRGLTLPAGPHRIRVTASGYQALVFNVQIEPNQTVTYRGALEAIGASATAAAPPQRAAGRTQMYLIPKCYLGNVPPRPERLPAGCDIKRVQVLR